jgi:hypothetical protein
VNPSLHQSRAQESVQVALSHLTFNQVIQGSIFCAIIELTAISKITADFGLLCATSSHLPHKSPNLFDSCSSE